MKCYQLYEISGKTCDKSNCRHWLDLKQYSNCTVIASKDGPMTLQKIGDIFGITRMRVCQIEKKILTKIKPYISNIRQ
jgi:hypothetical protein